MKQNTN